MFVFFFLIFFLFFFLIFYASHKPTLMLTKIEQLLININVVIITWVITEGNSCLFLCYSSLLVYDI